MPARGAPDSSAAPTMQNGQQRLYRLQKQAAVRPGNERKLRAGRADNAEMGFLSTISTALLTVPLVLSAQVMRLARAAGGLRPVAKRRRPDGRRLSRGGVATGPIRPPPAVTQSTTNVVSMSRELRAVLDGHDGSREVFRYLGHFERRFAKGGLKTLDDMPTDRLRRALAQLEAIVSNWSALPLAELRSRMAVAVTDRDSGAAMWAPEQTLSKAYGPREMPMLGRSPGTGSRPAGAPFQASRQVEVEDDIGISRFEAAVHEWQPSGQPATPAPKAGVPVP